MLSNLRCYVSVSATVFCATGQMGFSRQLTPEEILEQVSRFVNELASSEEEGAPKKVKSKQQGNNERRQQSHGRRKRLSNIVFMGTLCAPVFVSDLIVRHGSKRVHIVLLSFYELGSADHCGHKCCVGLYRHG